MYNTCYCSTVTSDLSLLNILNILDSNSKTQEVADKTNDELFTPNTFISEQLSEDVPLEDNSLKPIVKDLPDVPVISNSSNASLIENSSTVNTVDR